MVLEQYWFYKKSLEAFLFFLFKKLFMCMGVTSAWMSVHYMHAWCPRRREEAIGSSGTGVTQVWAAKWVLGINPGPLQEQHMLLTSESSLHPPSVSITWNNLSSTAVSCGQNYTVDVEGACESSSQTEEMWELMAAGEEPSLSGGGVTSRLPMLQWMLPPCAQQQILDGFSGTLTGGKEGGGHCEVRMLEGPRRAWRRILGVDII